MVALTTPPQRHPKIPPVSAGAVEPKRKPALKEAADKRPLSPRRDRSRSPLERKVQIDPKAKVIPNEENRDNSGLMRMKDAREAVPRLDGERRSKWKQRIFQHKRKKEEEAQSSQPKRK